MNNIYMCIHLYFLSLILYLQVIISPFIDMLCIQLLITIYGCLFKTTLH